MSNLFTSSIGRKLVMSLSGLFLILFLLVHLVANLMIFGGQESYNAMTEFMGSPVVVTMVPVLALGFIIHIAYAFILTLKNRSARPVEYKVQDLSKSSTWESRNMFVLGLIVFGILALHLYDFWAKMQLPELLGQHGHENPFQLVVEKFTNPVMVAIYLAWIVALWFHLRHGFWSAFQSVGLNNQKWIKRWRCAAKIYAMVVAVGFAIIPLYVYFITVLRICTK